MLNFLEFCLTLLACVIWWDVQVRDAQRMTERAPQDSVTDDELVVIELPKRFARRLRQIAVKRGMPLEAFMLACVAEYEKAKREELNPIE